MNLSLQEKNHLDIHKWIWTGDNIEDVIKNGSKDGSKDGSEDDRDARDIHSEGGYVEPMILGTVSNSKVSSKEVSRKKMSSHTIAKSDLVPSSYTQKKRSTIGHESDTGSQKDPLVMQTQTTPITVEKGES